MHGRRAIELDDPEPEWRTGRRGAVCAPRKPLLQRRALGAFSANIDGRALASAPRSIRLGFALYDFSRTGCTESFFPMTLISQRPTSLATQLRHVSEQGLPGAQTANFSMTSLRGATYFVTGDW